MGDTSISDLMPDPVNARTHTERGVGMIKDALRAVGAARSIVIDEGGRILAGNATVEAAKQSGIEKLCVIDVDGDTLVAVRRRNLTEEQKRRLALFDNRAAEESDWNTEVLTQFAADGLAMDDLFTPVELADLIDVAPDFEAATAADQGQLDEKAQIRCPHCGEMFTPPAK